MPYSIGLLVCHRVRHIPLNQVLHFDFQLDGQIGDEFMNQIQSIAAYVPYMTSPGNHEES